MKTIAKLNKASKRLKRNLDTVFRSKAIPNVYGFLDSKGIDGEICQEAQDMVHDAFHTLYEEYLLDRLAEISSIFDELKLSMDRKAEEIEAIIEDI